jgi:fucokinase
MAPRNLHYAESDGIRPAHLEALARGWSVLRLAVSVPERVPGWDAVVLTASNARQADLYHRHLEAARRRGCLPPATRALVVPDPEGGRVGSGGATLNALRQLAAAAPGCERMRVLLVHAGGESRRIPWAGVPGKPFLPLPLLADADSGVFTLLDQILAVAAPMALAAPPGALVTLAGDVLPLFDAAGLELPSDGGLVVTCPVSPDVAGRHGVVVCDASGRVVRLLQKAPAAALADAGALAADGTALVDTGIYAFTGSAYRGLVALARGEPDPVGTLVARGETCSLYEEIASAFVAANRAELPGKPLGRELAAALPAAALAAGRVRDLAFLHFGTTAEVLRHLRHDWHGGLSRRVLAACGPGVADTARVYEADLHAEARVGDGSLVYRSRLGPGMSLGARCAAVGVDADAATLRLPDNLCLWQVPLAAGGGGNAVVTAVCGVDDNPKTEGGLFLNRSMPSWMEAHGVTPDLLWDPAEPRSLWHARLFPARPAGDDLATAAWLLEEGGREDPRRAEWARSQRFSMATLQAAADTGALAARGAAIAEDLALRAIRRTVMDGPHRNIRALGAQLRRPETRAAAAALAERPHDGGSAVPASRACRVRADLLHLAGRAADAARAEAEAFAAVQQEVARAVAPREPAPVRGLAPGTTAQVELPVRFDVAGGWSDTPPYCLERPAGVLNMAVALDGALPIGASVEALESPVWELTLGDGGQSRTIAAAAEAGRLASPDDPFALLRTALQLAGYGGEGGITQGVRVRTWSRVPRGSGLGASSILGAALVTALERLAGRADDRETVSDLVLLLEQRMTTGGGWQDQVGGLVPGVKYIAGAPVRPLRLRIEPVPVSAATVAALERRLVIAFTGQERLARDVLQIVVGRYLQRDARLLAAIEELVRLADVGRRALAAGDLDGLGAVLGEAWQLHQQLDPHCSNPAVDALFRRVDEWSCGGKLAGAGGGGFLGVMAKDEDAAGRIRNALRDSGAGVRVYDWRLWNG